VLFRRPLFLVGTVAIGAWVIGSQYSFTWTVTRLDTQIAVNQRITPASGRTTDEFEVTLTVSNASALSVPIDVSLQPSPAVTALPEDRQSVRVDPGDSQVEETRTFRCPVAGRVTFDPPRFRVTDQFGLFQETVPLGPKASATVDPPSTTDKPLQTGDELAAFDGDQTPLRGDASLSFRGIREYVPSDPANRIDWRASARHGELKVVEFEAQADRNVGVVIDRRPSLAAGPRGRTKFDYCREAALSFVDTVATEGDTLSLSAFDEDGPSVTRGPGSGREWYATLKSLIRDLAPQREPAGRVAVPAGVAGGTIGRARARRLDAADAATLSGDQSAFGAAVRPFCRVDRPDHANGEDGSLTEAVTAIRDRLEGVVWTVIFTDDTRPAETRESVRLAREGKNRVLLFLTPSSRFDSDEVSDINSSRGEFESLRRKLDRLSRVRVIEVGPETGSTTSRRGNQHSNN
jgi:uncharacterized protein (DUF58 family)